MIINPWKSSSMRMALSGQSFIDAKTIRIQSKAEAEKFLASYGFDFDDDDDQFELEALRLEAIAFIETCLLNPNEYIPQALTDESDIRELLLIASGKQGRLLSAWSASILRVMHTLLHSHSYLNDLYRAEIQSQIFERFEQHLCTLNGKTIFGYLPIHKFEFRKRKARWSVAMKLMHKTENVAADIFDWIGVRLIANNRADVLELLAFIRNEHIINFANIKPSRSRNSLIDFKWVDQLLTDKVPIAMIKTRLQSTPYPNDDNQQINNPFSETSYHAVQLTCRQRIKVKQTDGSNLSFYFPFEVQLLDKQSYLDSREGYASHDQYKNRQRLAVRKRILPFLRTPATSEQTVYSWAS